MRNQFYVLGHWAEDLATEKMERQGEGAFKTPVTGNHFGYFLVLSLSAKECK